MNKIYTLIATLALGTLGSINAMDERPRAYQIIDEFTEANPVQWGQIFRVLDDQRYNIDVNTYLIAATRFPLLTEAISTGNIPAIKTLLENYNANPNLVIDATQITPFMTACLKCDAPMVKLLLSHGGDPEQRDARGRNSIDFAKSSPRKTPEKLKQVLDLLMGG